MDVERLAKELSPLRYQTGHRFKNEEPFWERLNEDDLRGLLNALRDRGYSVSADSPHVKSPSMYSPGYGEDESGAGFGVSAVRQITGDLLEDRTAPWVSTYRLPQIK